MKLPQYPLVLGNKLMTFEFDSKGPKGVINKMVLFHQISIENVYNLSFGDKDSTTGEIDDKVISNNGDSEKVLATVVAAIDAFTKQYPDSWIFATGSTKSRTRLYRMGITKFLSEVENNFELLGLINNEWEAFRKDVEYDGFLARKKII